ncbi:hypothetical protein [Paracnuella aquatica]|uniref:hypothetical protein n=1 Tax=Paracnuella aquatica TaxID=2268757 RepID=UPI000DEF7E02|nr:hypothetical protein [Paracnuella aquatica]RPD49012.1 hypothetical protein DRJ53_07785 [Paracnuella aquatica]
MTHQNLNTLKDEVETVLGRKILTASDCTELSNDIFRKTNNQLSLNTLRRFFNLMESKYSPSLFTLDLLSKYCGFNTFSEFTDRKQSLNHTSDQHASALLNFLTMLFRDVDVKGLDDLTYCNLIREVLKNLQQWPHVIDPFQSQIAKTRNGQLFYYEQFVNIDKLNSYFGDGLRYYLLENKTADGQVHGHALLCLRDWLTGNAAGVGFHAAAVAVYHPHQLNNMFNYGRYFAAQLFQSDILGCDVYRVMEQTREFYNEFRRRCDVQQSFPCFEYVIAETLVLIGQFEEANFYINEAIKKRNNHIPPHVDLRMLESIYLFQAVAMANLGKTQRSKDILETIDVKNLSFMSRRLHSILYLIQKLQFHCSATLERQLAYLVSQTGFVQLVKGLPEVARIQSEIDVAQVVGKNGQDNIEAVGYF